MRVRATATRDPRSNALGTVELECTPAGLAISYFGVSPYTEGYAPGISTEHVQRVVPWPQVIEASGEAEQLYLVLDPEITPLNRLLLGNFRNAHEVDHRELYRRRLMVRLATAAAIIVASILTFVAVSRTSADRPLLVATLVAAGASVSLLGLGLFADNWVLGGKNAAFAREYFLGSLSVYLPNLLRGPKPQRKANRGPLLIPERFFPHSTTTLAIVLGASGLATLLTGKWLFEKPIHHSQSPAPLAERQASLALEPKSEEASLPAVPSAAATTPSLAHESNKEAGPAAPGNGECRCERTHSVLWQNGLPLLSPILISQRSRAHNNHTHLELELGLVNNGNADLKELTLHVQFYEEVRGKPREARKNRALYYEGPLRPGEAVKWHVEGRATNFEVEMPNTETLNPDASNTASREAFNRLASSANHRPIRLHAAMFLAFLGDARAREVALSLRDALREDEGPYLDRVVAAVSPVRACDIRASELGAARQLQACVFNAGGVELGNLQLRVRALDRSVDHRSPVAAPPIIIAEQHASVHGKLAAGSGQLLAIAVDTTNPDGLVPKTFEVLADEP